MADTLNLGELLNLVGLSTGVVLYAMLLAMVLRAARASPGRRRVDTLLLATSILGLVWNVCALPAYELSKAGVRGPFPSLTALGFTALGFLPAVVVHSVLRGRDVSRRPTQTLLALAYVVSSVAAGWQLQAAVHGAPLPSVPAMRLLTYTYVALVLPLALVTRGQPGARRAMWVAALAVFAVSALHLSQFHRGGASWPVELIGHHASLPLAFAILYQDYPFALADLFLKRALAFLAVVTVAFIGIATFGVLSASFARFVQTNPGQFGLLVVLCVGTAVVYPALRRLSAWFVDHVVLDRADYPSLRANIARTGQAHEDVPPLLTDVTRQLAPAINARRVSWQEWHASGEDASGPRVLTGSEAAAYGPWAAVVILPVADAPRYALMISELTGGRRILSDDLAALEAIAVTVARRIDTIRIASERQERRLREEEFGRLAAEAELRALRAQVNPHFLFNALTTIGYLIQAAPERALQTLMRLTSLLRAVLRSEGAYTTLGDELEVVAAYLDIERARFDERLSVRIEVPRRLRRVQVPPLILQPLVENAIKHGIARREKGGEVAVQAAVDRTGPGGPRLILTVSDTGAGATAAALQRGCETGVGLRNVEGRLAHQYGEDASVTIRSSPECGTVVTLQLPIDGPRSKTADRMAV